MYRHDRMIVIILKYLLLGGFAFLCVYPLYWVLICSLKTNDELFVNAWGLPETWRVSNYVYAMREGNIGRYFINSVIVTSVSVVLSVIIASMAAYGVSRLKWRFSRLAAAVFSLGLMIPAYGSIIPLFSMFSKMRILNTYVAVIVPHITFSMPMAMLIMIAFFATVPRELEEAAVIDGCPLLLCFFKVILPISVSSVVTVAVVSMISIWNDLLFAQIFLTETYKMTLPVGLTAFQGLYATDYVGMLAAIVVTVVPVIVAYVTLHERIIEGMSAGAVKG